MLKLFNSYIIVLLHCLLIVFLAVYNLPHFKILSLAFELVSCFLTNSLDIPFGILVQLMVIPANVNSVDTAKNLAEMFVDLPNT